MKHKNKLRKLSEKQKAFDTSYAVAEANRTNPGSFHRPGSLKK